MVMTATHEARVVRAVDRNFGPETVSAVVNSTGPGAIRAVANNTGPGAVRAVANNTGTVWAVAHSFWPGVARAVEYRIGPGAVGARCTGFGRGRWGLWSITLGRDRLGRGHGDVLGQPEQGGGGACGGERLTAQALTCLMDMYFSVRRSLGTASKPRE